MPPQTPPSPKKGTTEIVYKKHIKTFRLTDKELAVITKKAKQANLSFSQYVVRACLDKRIVVIDGLIDIRRHLSSIGNNLNQLTTLCNMGRISAVRLDEAIDVLYDTKDIIIHIDKLVKRT